MEIRVPGSWRDDKENLDKSLHSWFVYLLLLNLISNIPRLKTGNTFISDLRSYCMKYNQPRLSQRFAEKTYITVALEN